MSSTDALVRLKARLIARRNALRKAFSGDLETFRNDAEATARGDSVDAAVDSANDEICSQLVEHESRELAEIERALERIARGVYGRCELCGGRIPATRLNALPYAGSCISCQREYERAGHSAVHVPNTQTWPRVAAFPADESRAPTRSQLKGFITDFSESS